MKRSINVSAPLLAAAALSLLTGCRENMKRCVDEQGHVVADNLCQNQPNNGVVHGAYSPTYYPYRYYYGGSGSYGIGSSVTGGSFTPSPGTSYSTSTTRGGFGGSADSSGGGHAGSGSGS